MTDKENGTRFHLINRDSGGKQLFFKVHDGRKMFPVTRDEVLSYTKLRNAVFHETGRLWGAKQPGDWDVQLKRAEAFPECHLLVAVPRIIESIDWKSDPENEEFGNDDGLEYWDVPLTDDSMEDSIGYPTMCRNLFQIDPDLDALYAELESEAVSFDRTPEFLSILHVEWLAVGSNK